jgi:hypothetical protein
MRRLRVPETYAGRELSGHKNSEPLRLAKWRDGPTQLNLTGDGEPQKVETRGVTANFFPLLGAAQAGRWFAPEEDKPGANRVVMEQCIWQQRYGGTNVLGTWRF